MTRLFLFAFIVLMSGSAFSQSDSIFLKQNSKPILGRVLIIYRKAKVNVNGSKDGAVTFPFGEIRRISLSNGGVYLSENLKSQPRLMLLLVEGKYSLLFSEKEKLFYVRKNDSLLVISQAHFKRALPLIFGNTLTEEYYKKTNISPDYTASYLRRLTSFANAAEGRQEIVYEQTINKFKKTVSVGPYVGFGYNKIAFDLYWDNVGGKSIFKKTDYFASNSTPVGLSLDFALFRRVSVRLDAYYNQTSSKNLDVDNMGSTKTQLAGPVLQSKKYADDIKFTGYSYKTVHFDLAASYALLSEERSKLSPYIFVGPSIVRMIRNEAGIAVGYSETSQAPYQYMTRYAELKKPFNMIAFNAGIGAQYKPSSRMTLRLSGKYIHGLFPKMINQGYSDKTENSIPMPPNGWNEVYHRFQNAYDQYTRIITITGGAYFQL